jgi:tetratricopeptide (TPR) repeat protein
MYRRNITYLLTPLAWVLALAIGYHLLLKPAIAPAPLPIDTGATETVEAVAPPPPPPSAALRKDDVSTIRALDQTAVPAVPHQSTLETIRDVLEKRDLPAAETKLNELPPEVLSNEGARRFVAILWNNLGLQREQLHGTSVSVKAFRKAADLDDSNPVILLNLAHAYWEQRDRALNLDLLTKLTSFAPDEPFPHLAMADLLQEQDRLGEAVAHLDQATERAWRDPALQSYLTAVTAKVRRTESAEARMTARSTSRFLVKFDGTEDQETWVAVLEILEEAYREIGQKLNYFPRKPITVVIQTKESFQSASGSPSWADALYDPTLGRIQLPTKGATTDTKWLSAVLRHEYVHAVLHERLGTSSSALPTWLNEGLAMQMAGDPWPELAQAIPGTIRIIPLNYLEGSWGALSANEAALAYLEANSATGYLIDRWGMGRIDALLSAFKARQPVAVALQNTLSVSYEQFQHEWLNRFAKRHTRLGAEELGQPRKGYGVNQVFPRLVPRPSPVLLSLDRLPR